MWLENLRNQDENLLCFVDYVIFISSWCEVFSWIEFPETEMHVVCLEGKRNILREAR